MPSSVTLAGETARETVGKSLSTIVNVAVVWVPNVAPPVGLLKVKLTVSFPSKSESLTIGMITVLLVSPGPKTTGIAREL